MSKLKVWKPIDLKKTVGKRNVWDLPLSELLEIADKLFPTTDEATMTTCYNYSLCRFPYGWNFNVVNGWHNWMDKGLEHKFGAYKKPEFAIAAFLEYCLKNNIQPHKLYNK